MFPFWYFMGDGSSRQDNPKTPDREPTFLDVILVVLVFSALMGLLAMKIVGWF